MEDLELKIFPPADYKSIEKREHNLKGIKNILSVLGFYEEQRVKAIKETPVMVSSVYGRIRSIVFHYDLGDEESTKNNAVEGLQLLIEELMRKMPRVDHFILITNEVPKKDYKFKIESKLEKLGLADRLFLCKVIPISLNISAWASDPYKAVYYVDGNEKRLHLFEPQNMIHRTGCADEEILDKLFLTKKRIPQDIQNLFHSSHDEERFNLSFDGGNILVGERFVLIGADTESANVSKEEELKEKFEKLLTGKKELLLLKGEPPQYYARPELIETEGEIKNILATREIRGICCQPLFHLDLFITLAGEKDGKEQLVIGKPVVGLPMKTLRGLPYHTLGMIYDQIYQTEYSIQQVIKQLEGASTEFEIIRIPMPLTYHNDFKDHTIRKWYWATYNNCIVEVTKNSEKTVWLPSYLHDYKKHYGESYSGWKDDLAPYEDEAKAIWKKLGFKVVMINAHFHMYAQSHGSLACLVNCIDRENQIETI
ncbi:hypothetical protein [Aureispira anguillae]|uniref:Uncharacterized protein n=1 Tax=Aureispira anguillae TaxID=2864201 RepID=A0A915YG80_9BACT|nr:hypothetical protein [Aureispira anguillae]BDS12450.1 hypothetical protein AsAng_0031730 [Aureispira anguillae]